MSFWCDVILFELKKVRICNLKKAPICKIGFYRAESKTMHRPLGFY
ncbi:hypothetical protein O6B35_02115 [Campylobacter ureolyticus]|nr:hypothetical protein [Campylobacter ureolyticus]